MSPTRDSVYDPIAAVTPDRFYDERGYVVETFNKKRFTEQTGFSGEFVQDNQSHSTKGVLRGLHYQVEPRAQGKLIRVSTGVVFDVAVDIRKSSLTFGDWFGIELSAEEGNRMWVPPGFAHGYLALTETVDVLYKTTDFYSPDHARSIRWDDPTIGITWPVERVGSVLLSEKDAAAPLFTDVEMFT